MCMKEKIDISMMNYRCLRYDIRELSWSLEFNYTSLIKIIHPKFDAPKVSLIYPPALQKETPLLALLLSY